MRDTAPSCLGLRVTQLVSLPIIGLEGRTSGPSHTHTHKRTGADGTPQLRGKRALPVLPRKKDFISEGDCTRHPAKVDLKEDTAEANSTSMSRAHRVETLNAA